MGRGRPPKGLSHVDSLPGEKAEKERLKTILATVTGDLSVKEACGRLEPEEPHYSLGMVGVRHEHHGCGYGRLLLDAVHVLSDTDPESHGVALSTETRENLDLYRHFGYEVIGEAHIDDLTTWALYRRSAVS